LIYLAVHKEPRVTITDIAERYNISRNHLVKVVHYLSTLGYLRTTRGRNGGMYLGKSPEEINLGEVVRHTEGTLEVIDCFNPNQCAILPSCTLRNVLMEARNSFMTVLDRYSLADLVANSDQLRKLLFQKTA
jgi:Rrf2 family nitric oxide-sensitive transcriptional repressor